ncbi:hypothetical protein ABZ511_03725 [Nocardia gamkensis]|uniref:hypothetical protein n=1 Tax=Nocardia gamkensis TaxID=352869 RepID=UPI0033C033D2
MSGLVANNYSDPALISAQTRDPSVGFVFDNVDLPTQFGDLSVVLGLACGDGLPLGHIAPHRSGDRAVAFAGTTHLLA